MKFREWCDLETQDAGGPGPVRSARSRLFESIARNVGCSVRTIRDHYRGALVSEYPLAKAISGYTDGAVTVADLCES